MLPLNFLAVVRDGVCRGLSYEVSLFVNLYISILCILLPSIINFVISLTTFIHLRKKQLHINRKSFKKSKSLFKITLSLNLLFFIFNLPPFVVFIIFNLAGILFSDLLANTLFLLSYFYYSFDFLIYFVANRKFRETCSSFFKCRK
jgi:hypothetical protein